MSSWKDAERQVAKFFFGIRNIRKDYSTSDSDVDSDIFTIEVKYTKSPPSIVKHFDNIPKIDGKINLLVVNRIWNVCFCNNFFTLFQMSFNNDYLGVVNMCEKYLKKLAFLKHFEQSRGYGDRKDLFPLLVYKQSRRPGFYIIWNSEMLDDFRRNS